MYNAIAQTNSTATNIQPVHVKDVIITKDNQDVDIDGTVENRDPKKIDTNSVFTAVEQEPQFSGGMAKFYKYINDHKKQPDSGFVNTRKEIVTFIVERNGSLSNIKVLRGISEEYDKDALRLVQQSPKWIPGVQYGIAVRVQYTIVISYLVL